MEFEETHDWSVLADYFGVTVPNARVDRQYRALKRNGLLAPRHDEDYFDQYMEGLRDYDLVERAKREPHKQAIREELLQLYFSDFLWTEFRENDHSEVVDVVRDFVEQHAEDSIAKTGLFWEKVAEIEDDHAFLMAVASNVEHLWW